MAKSGKKWSADLTAHDHPFDLEPGLFANGSAQQIAAALKKSAEDPTRQSGDPYRTAMSMLDFYVNRAGDKPRLLREIREISRYRDLLFSLVYRDLTVRYKRSYLGFLWTMLHPFLLMVIFVIVFAALSPSRSAAACPGNLW